jgi:hypothetical protein
MKSSVPPPAAARVAPRRLDPGTRVRRLLPLALALAMTATVLAGFRPFYAGLFEGAAPGHWLIGLHAAVFSLWLVLLLAQVSLVALRRVDLHRRLGMAGVGLGLLVFATGIAITVVGPVLAVEAGRMTFDEAAGFLILPIGDMALFAGFFAAGIAQRRRPEIHKRLMILAAIALVFPAAARIGGESLALALAIWLLPLAIAMLHEWSSARRISPVYLAGAAILLLAFARIAWMDAPSWLAIGRPLLALFAGIDGA